MTSILPDSDSDGHVRATHWNKRNRSAFVLGRMPHGEIHPAISVRRTGREVIDLRSGGYARCVRDAASAIRRTYPDEPRPALVQDVRAAAQGSRHVLKSLVDAYPSEALQALMEVLEQAPSVSKPMWRRMVENLFVDVQSTPIPDRVTRACDHIRAAGDVIRERALPAR
jgi:hypothetical protein